MKQLRTMIRKISDKTRKNKKKRLRKVQVFKEIYVLLYYFDITS